MHSERHSCPYKVVEEQITEAAEALELVSCHSQSRSADYNIL